MTNSQSEGNKLPASDSLRKVWEEQASFQVNFVDLENMTLEERTKFTKENMLALHRELGELLNELPWKPHRTKDQHYNIDNVQEEMIDCFKYMINLALTWGVTPEKFVELFDKKSAIVKARFDKEKETL